MSRFERGYGLSSSPWVFRSFSVRALLSFAVAVLFWTLPACTFAQDVNVHIEPREKTAPPANPSDAAKNGAQTRADRAFRKRG